MHALDFTENFISTVISGNSIIIIITQENIKNERYNINYKSTYANTTHGNPHPTKTNKYLQA